MSLQIYPNDLEESFNKFEDLAQTFPLYRGKGSRDPEELEGESVGLLKGSLKVYPLPDDGSKEPPPVFSKTINTKPVECVVRIYVIRVSPSPLLVFIPPPLSLVPSTSTVAS